MNTRKLEIILKAVETGSISKTAEAMFLSQPSVSESIGSVEKELGIKIFRRSNRGIELTDDGEIFTAYARSIVRNAELMESIGDKHKKCSVSLHGPNISILNDCFVEFCKKHRDSDYIHLTQSNRFYRVEEAEKEILAGECDIAIAHSTPAVYGAMERKLDMRGIFSAILVSLPLMLFVSKGHPLAKTGFDKEELRNYICIYDVDPSEMAMFSTPELTEAISWDRMIRVVRLEPRLKLVSEGVGYQIGPPLPEEILEHYNITALPTPCGEYSLICLCSKNRMSDPYVRELLDGVLQGFRLAAERQISSSY
jgi:DNA-binding transcriptional LysR family regulator